MCRTSANGHPANGRLGATPGLPYRAYRQGACKPGSVPHAVSRGTGRAAAAIRLGFGLLRSSSSQPGRSMRNAPARLRGRAAPIRPCSGWGLPCGPRCRSPGALLPHPFTLACSLNRVIGGLLSVALSVTSQSQSPGVTRHLTLWSSDFPPSTSLKEAEGGPHFARPTST